MLAQSHRFHGHGSLGYVYRNGQSVRSHLFTVRYTPNKRRKQSRFAVVVSKKVLKSAVGRNRIRRRIYEQIRETVAQSPVTLDLVCIVVSAEVRDLEPAELRAQWLELVGRIDAYKTTV